jgi:hypothetical protein
MSSMDCLQAQQGFANGRYYVKEKKKRWDYQVRDRKLIIGVIEGMHRLDTLKTREMAAEYERVFGYAPTDRHRQHLKLRLSRELQRIAMEKAAVARASNAVPREPAKWRKSSDYFRRAPAKTRDPRIPPVGTVLKRKFKGVEHEVEVLEDGFRWKGKKFFSLSAIARKIALVRWNGLAFFKLTDRKPAPKKESKVIRFPWEDEVAA